MGPHPAVYAISRLPSPLGEGKQHRGPAGVRANLEAKWARDDFQDGICESSVAAR